MSVDTEDLFRMVRNQKHIGKKTLEALTFMMDNAQQDAEFFAEATRDGRLPTVSMSRIIRAVKTSVCGALYQEFDTTLQDEIGDTLIEYVRKWSISPDITHRDQSKVLKFYDPKYTMPMLVHESASTAKHVYGIKGPEYNVQTIKVINCLCEVHFGDRLFPTITPQEDYSPTVWAELKQEWAQRQNTAAADETPEIAPNQQQIMLNWWNAQNFPLR